eukprot:gene9310-14433_t
MAHQDSEHLDVIIVGAGLSGVDAAYYLQKMCPQKTYAILEGRAALGGTWDLFRYPGVRSDSDMFTLGFSFQPWRDPTSIADGGSILEYIRSAAETQGIDKKIRYNHWVKSSSWSTPEARWTLSVKTAAGEVRLTCRFLVMCSGYYSYDKGHTPAFKGADQFGGRIVHPQQWTPDIVYEGKKVVVIGSGATAVTLVPSLAETAEHVTMLQRSPTYIVPQPKTDPLAATLFKWLPASWASFLARCKQIFMSQFVYWMCLIQPAKMKAEFLGFAKRSLGGDAEMVAKHFTPSYNPWDQRICLDPNAVFFKSIRAGKASVVTEEIDRFVDSGVKLVSGEVLPADLIVTATGLDMVVWGNMACEVDGKCVVSSDIMTYKGMMFTGVPNLVSIFGYVNASWTLKADLICEHTCRLINYMDSHGYKQCVPRCDDEEVQQLPLFTLSSGYMQRGRSIMPKQGTKAPWTINQNYFRDLVALRHATVANDALKNVLCGGGGSPPRLAPRMPALARLSLHWVLTLCAVPTAPSPHV